MLSTATDITINPQATHCICTLRPDGIYVFTFPQGTHQATDEWLMHLDTIMASISPDVTMRYVMDYREGVVPSLVYSANKSRDWLRRNPNYNPARVAFIHRSAALMTMLESIVKLLRAHKITPRFFTDEAKALAWLQSESSG